VSRALPAAALVLILGCKSPPPPNGDVVLLDGAPLTALPEAWLAWRPVGVPEGLRGGLVVFADGRIEAAIRAPGSLAELQKSTGRIRRRRGELLPEARAELERALDVPPAAPRGGSGPPDAVKRFEILVRGADGAVRRIPYEQHVRSRASSGGEPLHGILLNLVESLPE
jgi:hypothetical protein